MKRNSALTLIEILVVLVIVAILAGLILPVIAKSRESAKITASMSNMRQLSMGLALYREQWAIKDGVLGSDGVNSRESKTRSELGFGPLREIVKFNKFPLSILETGGNAYPDGVPPRYVVMSGISDDTADNFLREYAKHGESTVWLVDPTHNPTHIIRENGELRTVLGARLDTSVERKKVRGEITRFNIWHSSTE